MTSISPHPTTETQGVRGHLSPLSVLCLPSYLRPTYRRLVLVSHPRHLAGLDLADAESLVVATDWLTWRQAVDRGGHCVHYEGFLEEWPAERGQPGEQYLRAAQWMLEEGHDPTLFHGVSLGRAFANDVMLFRGAFSRIHHALTRIVAAYRPEEVVLVDLHFDRGLLDSDSKRILVGTLAERHGLRYVEALDVPDDEDPGRPDHVFRGLPAENPVRVRLRRLYEWGVETAFRLARPFAWRRPKVFVWTNRIVMDALLARFDRSRGFAPLIVAGQFPKSLSFLWFCWQKGILPVAYPTARLSRAEEEAIAEILRRVEARLRASAEPVDRALVKFLMPLMRDEGRFRQYALIAKGFVRFFRRAGMARVLVGDAGSPQQRLVIEAAKVAGVAVDELPNGMFLPNQKVETRTGDAFGPPRIDRFLSWGVQNEEWMRAIGSPVPCVRVGYPIIEELRDRVVPRESVERALILPPIVDAYDPIGLHANKIACVVEAALALREAGFRELRVKLHPGPPRLAYYEAALRYYGIDVQVFKAGSLLDQVLWADVVIGPVNSGSMVEVLAAGRPYFALAAYPTFIAPQYTDRIQSFSTVAQLKAALVSGWRPDRHSVLEYLCSVDSIPDSSQRVWEAIEQAVRGQQGGSSSARS